MPTAQQQDEIITSRTQTAYLVQRALEGAMQTRDAVDKITLPLAMETANAMEALELLRANISSVQMLLLVVSISNLKRPHA
jgi:hypothetical protein